MMQALNTPDLCSSLRAPAPEVRPQAKWLLAQAGPEVLPWRAPVSTSPRELSSGLLSELGERVRAERNTGRRSSGWAELVVQGLGGDKRGPQPLSVLRQS